MEFFTKLFAFKC